LSFPIFSTLEKLQTCIGPTVTFFCPRNDFFNSHVQEFPRHNLTYPTPAIG
jgi:hypothetical protein